MPGGDIVRGAAKAMDDYLRRAAPLPGKTALV